MCAHLPASARAASTQQALANTAGVLFFWSAHMSAKVLSREFAQGKARRLHRTKQPLVLTQAPPRNPVVYAMAHRAASAGAGKHVRAQGATRRSEKVALQKLVRQQEQ